MNTGGCAHLNLFAKVTNPTGCKSEGMPQGFEVKGGGCACVCACGGGEGEGGV